MIEEELEQDQVIAADFSAQEKVAPQSAVDVLDDRTGTDGLVGEFVRGLLKVVKAVAELLTQCRFFLPTFGLSLVQHLEIEQGTHDGHWNLKLGSKSGQILVELSGERQQLLAVVFQHCAYRIELQPVERCSVRMKSNKAQRSA